MSHRQVAQKISSSTYFVFAGVYVNCDWSGYSSVDWSFWTRHLIGHFTVVCSVTSPMNGFEAAGDLVLIQTSLLLSCKLRCCNAN